MAPREASERLPFRSRNRSGQKSPVCAVRTISRWSKRSAQKTPEPMGEGAARDDGRRFVIQEHHATRLHWDLRLEHDGVLASWAVPNGIPPDPKENRLAVRTEDHPLEYLDFHGEIPKGEYGAGSMTIWDRGTFELLKWEEKKVEVSFHGERLTGRYGLFPIGRRADGAGSANECATTGTPSSSANWYSSGNSGSQWLMKPTPKVGKLPSRGVKGSLDGKNARPVAELVGELARAPHAERLMLRPLADGGPGFVAGLQAALGGTLHTVKVTGPMSEPVTARGVVTLVATNYGLFEPTGSGFRLREIAPGRVSACHLNDNGSRLLATLPLVLAAIGAAASGALRLAKNTVIAGAPRAKTIAAASMRRTSGVPPRCRRAESPRTRPLARPSAVRRRGTRSARPEVPRGP